MDLTRREMVPELMDDPSIDPREHARALRGLARINRWSGSARILWPVLRDLARQLDRPLRLLDIATGGGDVSIALWRRAQRAGISLELAGCDISPQALAVAAERIAKAGARVELFRLDALHDSIPAGYDVITASLFLHHLTEEDGLLLLRRAGAAAGRAVLVNDLLRSMPGYLLAWSGTRVLSRSNMVRTDGPLSVRAAYNLAGVRRLAHTAGLLNARVERRWPCRFLMTWIRS